MKLGMISLGCAKNLIDTEMFLGVARKYGIEITNDMDEADILVVNTCGFIESAKKEAIDTILELTDYGKKGKKVIAMGCLVERYLDDLKESIPEVDFYFPIRDYKNIDKLFRQLTNSDSSYHMDYKNRVVSTLPHSAYLRIGDGCNNKCAYCAIPIIRGPFVSRPINDVIAEANTLVSSGVKEITLIAQDTTRYGTDLNDGTTLVKLIKELSKFDDLKVIRVLYLYPDEITDELLEEFRDNEKLVPYFDIPIQHASNRILKLMNRRGSKEMITKIINKLRSFIPDVIIRSTLIVGFPTETDEDFNELYNFVKEIKFDRLGVFTYSKEEDTKAYDMKPEVSEIIAKQRYNKIMKLQAKIIKEKNKETIGKVYKVLVDNYDFDKEKYISRIYAYAPDDVDGYIYIDSSTPLIPGEFYDVLITKADVYDLEGVVVEVENEEKKRDDN